MQDKLKKALLFGLGVFQISKEKVESFVEELQKDGDITPEEGKKLVQEVMSRFDNQKDKFTEDVEEIVKRVLKEMDLIDEKDKPKNS